jgi:hypothetical protein
MRYLLTYVLFFVLSLIPLSAQNQSPDTDNEYSRLYRYVNDEYGFDQVLVNGIFYEDIYRHKTGHQFFMEDQLYKGDLTFRGKDYKGHEMKYDIFNNQLILFVKSNFSVAWIVPPDDFISAFSLGDKHFSKFSFEGKPGFYQVVFDSDRLKCLYYWYKKMIENYGNHKYVTYEFFDGEKKCYLVLDGSFLTYRNNRSFLEILPGEIRDRARKYLKSNHIKVNKSNDDNISSLIFYCNSLL